LLGRVLAAEGLAFVGMAEAKVAGLGAAQGLAGPFQEGPILVFGPFYGRGTGRRYGVTGKGLPAGGALIARVAGVAGRRDRVDRRRFVARRRVRRALGELRALSTLHRTTSSLHRPSARRPMQGVLTRLKERRRRRRICAARIEPARLLEVYHRAQNRRWIVGFAHAADGEAVRGTRLTYRADSTGFCGVLIEDPEAQVVPARGSCGVIRETTT
jgi:hypothetical protein